MALTNVQDFNPLELAEAIEQEALRVGADKDPKVRLVMDLPDAIRLAQVLRGKKRKVL